MSRRWDTFPHVGAATRTSSGTATAGVKVGEYRDGQLIIRCTGLGVGGKITGYWQSSADGLAWGDLARGATMIATGVQILSMPGGIGNYARARWVVATGAKFGMVFTFKE
jgi:hypothetical protein